MAEAAVVDAPVVDAPAATEAPAAPAAPVWAPDPNLAKPAAEAPAATETPAPAADADADAKPAEAGADAATDTPEWKAKLAAKDPAFIKELLSDPVLQGHVGTLADRIAADKATRAAQQAREAELDRVAQEDPDNPLAQERLKQRQTELAQLNEVQTRLGAFEAAQNGVAAFVVSLPDEHRAEIAKLAPEGKAYGEPGDLKSGLLGYMADVAKGYAAAEVAKAKALWEKETLPGLRKEVQAEHLLPERSPDLGSSARTSGGAVGLTLDQYQKLTPDQALKLNPTDIDEMWRRENAAAAAGR